jgi:hypothetical protein
MQAFSAAGQEMYQAQAAEAEAEGAAAGAEAGASEGGPEAEPSEAPSDEDVVEADYEIVDEEK